MMQKDAKEGEQKNTTENKKEGKDWLVRSSPEAYYTVAGRKIAPNTGANATKFFTLATKSWKLVANLATRISNHTWPRDLVIVEDL